MDKRGVLSKEDNVPSKYESEEFSMSKSKEMLKFKLKRPVRAGLRGEENPEGCSLLWERI